MQDMISKERALMLAEYAWLKLTPDEIDAAGPGPLREDLFKKNQFIPIDLIAAMANPDYFPFTCKHILGVEIIPLQHLILKNMFKYPFPMLIASRGFGKTFMLAVYCFLRMLLNPGCRIVIAGAAFRQSKLVFEYMEKIWREAPILRDIGGPGSGPSKYNDHCIFRFGGGHTMAIPIGDGCLAGDTMIMCDDGFKTMESVINPSGEQEEFNAPYQGQVWDVTGWGNAVARRYNGVKPAIRLVTRRGYEITGTHNHKFEVFDGKEVVWRRLDQMAIGDRILINSRPRWHNGQSALNESDAYQLGRSFLGDELSPALLSSRKEVFSAFLQGWFDGRGYYDGNKEVYGKLPEKLSKQLQYIFLCYGFVSERRLSDDSYYELVVYKDTVFVDDEIISLEDAGNIPTYDIEIDEIHRYNANGFCSHNSKIRGLRANYIIMDEFASHSKEIFQRVIQGFASVSAKPIDNVKEAAKRRALKELGLWSERDEQRYQDREVNQTIITGTAYYSFNLFYEYWKQYKEILGSMGDPKKMRDVFGDDMSDFINYKDFCIMRIPYDLIPEGFMDDKQVSHNRATSHTSLYAMEYGSCTRAGEPVITHRGIVPIESVNIGDLVLTHKGRWRRVTKLTFRHYQGILNEIKTQYFNQSIGITADHPFWYGDDNFYKVQNTTCLTNLKELNGKTHLDLEDICTDYMTTFDEQRIYPKSSQNTLSLEQVRSIRRDARIQQVIAKDFNVTQSAVSSIKRSRRIPKGAIPKRIPLNYDFGLIVGYYAAEGSGGSDGRNIGFSLDEHKDTNYQGELITAIRKIFGLRAAKYIKQNNTVEVTVNSRLFYEVMKYICPGLSGDKLIKHDVLFSNADFLRGVIRGYWNGDGHTREEFSIVKCVNRNLLNQIRVALSYFGISSSLRLDIDNNWGYNPGEKYEVLQVSGIHHIRFNKEILGIEYSRSINTTKVVNNGDFSILPVTKCESQLYDGLVYNLEVEEDNSYSLPNATVHNCFSADSDGFFKRSLIESCTSPLKLYDENIDFKPVLSGREGYQYVMGIDPASEQDNLAIVIIEIHKNHRRIVYCWTINKKEQRRRVKAAEEGESDFYAFVARKIRQLMQVFKIERIGMDIEGGGRAIEEALHNKNNLRPGEHPIWQVVDDNKPKETDDYPGLHIIEPINFSLHEWVSTANHGLKKDMEDKFILFPAFDAAMLGVIIEDEKLREELADTKMVFDTLEDCMMDIEELKNELTTITVSATPNSGRERWDTPEFKLPGGRKGRYRKDRYSALLIANMMARAIAPRQYDIKYEHMGGFVGNMPEKKAEKMFIGPDWYEQKMRGVYD